MLSPGVRMNGAMPRFLAKPCSIDLKSRFGFFLLHAERPGLCKAWVCYVCSLDDCCSSLS